MYTQELVNQEKSQNNYLNKYREKHFEEFSELEVPKWKRVEYQLEDFPAYKSYQLARVNSSDENIIVKPLKETSKEEVENYIEIHREYGIDKKYTSLTEGLNNTGYFIYVPKNHVGQTIHIQFNSDLDNPLILDHNIIVLEENAEAEIIIEYMGEIDYTFHSGVSKIFAKDNAKGKIVKVQTLGDKAVHFDANVAILSKDAKVDVVHGDTGGEVVVSDYSNHLLGPGSELVINGIYIGDHNKKLDFSYKSFHEGIYSNSDVETRGVLKDQANKVFRGTLDFKKGARRSKGKEKEFVILLDETVKSQAIPALLCSEDDVEGEHAASAGQVDQQQLFYIMSRGFTENEAKKIVVEASFQPVIEQINHEGIRSRLENQMHRRLAANG